MKEHIFGAWQVVSAPEFGGNLSCVRWNGYDIMRRFSTADEWKAAPTNYGFAVLFPPNRIDAGKFEFDGKSCFLPVNEPDRNTHLHGVALREEWQLTQTGSDTLTMQYLFDEENSMYQGFPFKCRLSVSYTFEERALIQTFEVENLSQVRMPCALGFHTAFAIPQRVNVHGDGGHIELPPPRYLASGRVIPWLDGFEPDVWCDPVSVWPFGHLKTTAVPLAELEYKDFSLRYLPDSKFGYWMVWRKVDEFDYLCIEPMNIKIGTFENAPALLPVLEAGKSEKFISKIEII